MNITVSTAPTKQPLLVSDVKRHLQIEHTADDKYIEDLIKAATATLERYTGRAFMQQTITLDLDAYEAQGPITLKRAPFSSLTSFSYYDSSGNSNTVAATQYYVSGTDPAIVVAQDGGWELHRTYKALTLVYVAGYGASRSDVPAPLRQAIRVLVADMWNNPESMKLESRSSSFPTPLPTSAKALASPYRLLV